MIWKHCDSIQKLNNNNKKSKNIQFLKSSENISILLFTWGSEIVFLVYILHSLMKYTPTFLKMAKSFVSYGNNLPARCNYSARVFSLVENDKVSINEEEKIVTRIKGCKLKPNKV